MSDLPDDDSDSLILGYLLNEDDIVPIDFVCVKCNHSFQKHPDLQWLLTFNACSPTSLPSHNFVIRFLQLFAIHILLALIDLDLK